MNYYDILEVPRNADTEVIKKKYRRLALIYHPDRNNSKLANSAKFIEITEAYTILVNPLSRQKYDLQMAMEMPGETMNWSSKEDNNDLGNILELLENFLSSMGLDQSALFEKFGLDKENLETISKLTKLNSKQANVIFEMALDDLFGQIVKNKSPKVKTSSSHFNNKVPASKNNENNQDNQNIRINTEYRNIIIEYELEEHYQGDVTKILTLTSNQTQHQLEINTQIPNHSIEIILDNTFYLLDVKCLALTNEIFRPSLQKYNLIHDINIPFAAFVNGFYYELDIFGKSVNLFFRTPCRSNLVYKLPKSGLKNLETGERGDIILLLNLARPTQTELGEIKLVDIPMKPDYLEVDQVDLAETL